MRMNLAPAFVRLAPWVLALLLGGCAAPGEGRLGGLPEPASPPPPPGASPGASPDVRESLVGLRRGLSNQEERIEEIRRAMQGLVDSLERGRRDGEASVQKLGQQLEEMRGRVESLENELALARSGRSGAPAQPAPPAEAKPGAPPAGEGAPPAAVPGAPPAARAPQPSEAPQAPPAEARLSGPEEEFNQALKALQEDRSYPRARSLLGAFLAKHPGHELADDAQYWIGQTYFEERNYERAILAFNKVQVDYANGDKAPDALLQEGLSFLNLGDRASARELLMRLQQRYPNSEAARTAAERLKNLQ